MNDYHTLLTKYQSELTQLQIQQSKDQEKIKSLCSELGLDPNSPDLLSQVLATEKELQAFQSQYEAELKELISKLDE